MPGEQLGVRCLAQGSHLSRGQFLPEPRFEPTNLGYKSDALPISYQLLQCISKNVEEKSLVDSTSAGVFQMKSGRQQSKGFPKKKTEQDLL